jgi:hypothetical protein
MNEGQLERAVSAQAGGLQANLGQAQTRPIQQGKLAELVNNYEKNNARLNELILIQRDNITRITGINPVDEPPPTETQPESSGVISDFERAVLYHNELNTKLNAITDAIASI